MLLVPYSYSDVNPTVVDWLVKNVTETVEYSEDEETAFEALREAGVIVDSLQKLETYGAPESLVARVKEICPDPSDDEDGAVVLAAETGDQAALLYKYYGEIDCAVTWAEFHERTGDAAEGKSGWWLARVHFNEESGDGEDAWIMVQECAWLKASDDDQVLAGQKAAQDALREVLSEGIALPAELYREAYSRVHKLYRDDCQDCGDCEVESEPCCSASSQLDKLLSLGESYLLDAAADRPGFYPVQGGGAPGDDIHKNYDYE